MILATNLEDERLHLLLQGDLRIHTVKKVYETILEKRRDSNRILLDLTGIQSIDTAGVQLLLHFVNRFALENRFVSILGLGGETQERIENMGLESYFNWLENRAEQTGGLE